MHNVIGLDVGHSAVKLAATANGRTLRLVVPSFVCPAIEIADEAEQRRADKETVMVGGRPYFVGETARLQGQLKNPIGTYDSWISTPEYAALILGAFKKAAAEGIDIDKPRLVLGLPTHLFSQQKDVLNGVVSDLVQVDHLMVMPQPVGAYHATMLDEYGLPLAHRSMATQTWCVVDIGYYTTDFLVIQKGRFVQNAMGSCAGMRFAAEHLVSLLTRKGLATDIQEAEEALINRSIKYFAHRQDVGREVDLALAKNVTEVTDTLGRTISAIARQMDGLVVAGGGGGLIFPFIKAIYPTAMLATDSRFAVAEGMRRFGCAVRRIKPLSTASAATV